MAGWYALFTCITSALLVSAHQGDSATHRSVTESVSACTGENEDKARSLLQFSQEHKTVQKHQALEDEENKTGEATQSEAGPEDEKPHKDKEKHRNHSDILESKEPPEQYFNGSAWAVWSPERRITFVTIWDDFFDINLGTSQLWTERQNKPHQWIVINNKENEPISKVYAQAQKDALNEIVIFLHSDIYLPDGFYEEFMGKLNTIEAIDSNWGVLGAVGVPFAEFRSNSSITDFSQTYNTGHDFLPVQGVDECLMVLRKGMGQNKSSPSFDPDLPGFDLYGLDIVLEARQRGQMSYLLNVKVNHKVKDPKGEAVTNVSFNEKVDSGEYSKRVDTTAQYFQKKWCSSGFLPVMGPSFRVECEAWCKVITMLNRTHHREQCVDPTGDFQTHPAWE